MDGTVTAPVERREKPVRRWVEDPVHQGFVWTGLTLFGLVAGLVAPHVGLGALRSGFLLLAYAAGGVPASRVAWAELVGSRKLNVDLLMVVAALGAASVGQADDGAILLFLFSLSNTLQAWAFRRTEGAIRALMALNPEGATLLDETGGERWVPIEALEAGDLLLVRPGERFAADGRIETGYTSVDESAITGESVPVEKSAGDEVSSGTLNGEGVIRLRVARPASESTLARLIRLVEAAQAEKSPTEEFAAKLEGPYTIGVLISAPLVFVIMYALVGLDAAPAWYRAMTFLVVASPCAVVISTPSAVLSAMAAGARKGILFKSGAALEALSRAKVIAFDKTGTLTQGTMRLERVVAFGVEEPEAMRLAAGLERHSEHPIARAIVNGHEGDAPHLDEVRASPGRGIEGVLRGVPVWAGTRRLAADRGVALEPCVERTMHEMEEAGLTTTILGRDESVLAVLAVADTPRPEARRAVDSLHAMGLRTAMVSGDRAAVARAIGGMIGIDDVRAELLPQDKLRVISELRHQWGPVAMVGDGVNDAPALVAADLGIAVGSGSDVSLESSDVVLMKSDLSRLAGAVGLARATATTVRFNLIFALSIIVVIGAFALAGVVPLPVGVIAHEGGTLFVVANGLRLLRKG